MNTTETEHFDGKSMGSDHQDTSHHLQIQWVRDLAVAGNFDVENIFIFQFDWLEMEGGEEQLGCDGFHSSLRSGQAGLPPSPRHLLESSWVLSPRHPRRDVRWPPLPLLQRWMFWGPEMSGLRWSRYVLVRCLNLRINYFIFQCFPSLLHSYFFFTYFLQLYWRRPTVCTMSISSITSDQFYSSLSLELSSILFWQAAFSSLSR